MKNIRVIIALAIILLVNNAYSAEHQLSEKTSYSYIENASEKFMNRDIKGALEELNTAIKSNKENPELYLNRGYLKQVMNDFSGAMDDYNQALKISPNYAYAYNNRGVLKVEMNDIDGAMSDYETALKYKGNYSDVYYNRGNLKYMLGDNAGALSDFDKAIQLNPKDADAYNNRGVVKKRMNYNVGALSDYSQAIALNPNDSIAYANRGHLKKLYFDNEGAAIDLNQAVTLAENQVFIKNVKPLISKDNYITAIPVVHGITETPVTVRTNQLVAESSKVSRDYEKQATYEQKRPVNSVASTTRSLVDEPVNNVKTAYNKSKPANNNEHKPVDNSVQLNAGVATVKTAVPDAPKANPMVTPTTKIG